MVAAFLHLGYIERKDDIQTFNLVNSLSKFKPGELVLVGRDEMGRDVFVLRSRKVGQILAKTLAGIAQIYGFSADSVQLIDLNHLYNGMILFGIFFIRVLKLPSLGTRLMVLGIKKNFERLKTTVQTVKDKPIYIRNRGE